MITVDKNVCGVCGRCVAFCPREALSVTMEWGSLHIDEKACTECFGGSHQFVNISTGRRRKKLLDPAQTRWNLLCIENCPVRALSQVAVPAAAADGSKP